MKKEKIKILVSYKEEHVPIKTDIILPIQTGRSLTDTKFEGMIGDDTGDNISDKNERYCELTAQYWAWKNQKELGNPEYFGFMHWRRHFLFDESLPLPSRKWLNGSDFYLFDCLDESYMQYMTDDKICEILETYDIVVPKAYDFNNNKFKTVQENFTHLPGQKIENYHLMIEILKKEYPEYTEAIQKFEKGRFEYICNMYILRKDIFNQYNEFLFSVLDKLDSQIDYAHCSTYGERVLGYLGEMLFNIFLYKYVYDNPKVRIKSLCLGTLHEAELEIQPLPAFQDDSTAIAVPCSNFYAPYLSVYLESLIEHCDKKHNYDVIVLSDDITDVNKEKLRENLPQNFSLRFIDVSCFFKNMPLEKAKDYLSTITFYRLVIPKVMCNYSRVIVTDIDLIFLRDVAELDSMDIGNAPIASCIEPQEGINLNLREEERKYAAEVLALEDPYRYVNTGVMIVNNSSFTETDADNMIAMIDKKYRCHEQCILNAYFKERINILPPEWNFEVTITQFREMPKDMYEDYKKAEAMPKVMHWIGPNKPWNNPEILKGYKWWELARRTPYYEEILGRYIAAIAARSYHHLKQK